MLSISVDVVTLCFLAIAEMPQNQQFWQWFNLESKPNADNFYFDWACKPWASSASLLQDFWFSDFTPPLPNIFIAWKHFFLILWTSKLETQRQDDIQWQLLPQPLTGSRNLTFRSVMMVPAATRPYAYDSPPRSLCPSLNTQSEGRKMGSSLLVRKRRLGWGGKTVSPEELGKSKRGLQVKAHSFPAPITIINTSSRRSYPMESPCGVTSRGCSPKKVISHGITKVLTSHRIMES